MATYTQEHKEAELVGYTGHEECMEIRHCTDPAQVWDHTVMYGIGLGLGETGYWIGTDRYAYWVANTREGVERYAAECMDGSDVRFVC